MIILHWQFPESTILHGQRIFGKFRWDCETLVILRNRENALQALLVFTTRFNLPVAGNQQLTQNTRNQPVVLMPAHRALLSANQEGTTETKRKTFKRVTLL